MISCPALYFQHNEICVDIMPLQVMILVVQRIVNDDDDDDDDGLPYYPLLYY